MEILDLPKEVVISKDNVDVFFYPEKKLLYFIWKQRTTGEAYRQIYISALEYFEVHRPTHFLSDIRNQGIIGPNDRKWFQEEVIARALELGLKKSAAILDGNSFKLYYMNIIMSFSKNKGLPVKLFNIPEEAIQWLFD